MNTEAGQQPDTTTLRYDSIRTISSPEDRAQDRKVYSGHMVAWEVLKLPTNENVRDYLVEAMGKKRRVMTQVHRAILSTLENEPDNFSVLNGGVVIVARACVVNDKRKTIELISPSIINGSQTQGVLRAFSESLKRGGQELPSVHVTFELIVTDEDALIADISIARNYQNDVMTISIAGRRGQLDELEQTMLSANGERLRKKETEYAGDFIDTEKLIQVLTALMPLELDPTRTDRSYAYNRKTKCLKDFQKIYVAAKDPQAPNHQACAAQYQFFLDIAPEAWAFYKDWKSHPGFTGTRIRSIIRDKREIVEVPDGLVFPIIAAFSEFCVKRDGKWTIQPPPRFENDELIEAAKAAYQEVAKSKPHLMGKTKACYTALRQITSIYRRLATAS